MRGQGRGNTNPEDSVLTLLQQVSFLYLKDVKARKEIMHFECGLYKKMHRPPGNALSEKKSPRPTREGG